MDAPSRPWEVSMKLESNPPFSRVTVSLPPALVDAVERHRSGLIERVGVDLSRSAAMAQLLRAGLAADGKAMTPPSN